MKWLAPALVIAVAVWLATRRALDASPAFALPDGWQDPWPGDASSSNDPAPEPDQSGTFLENLMVDMDPRNLLPLSVAPAVAQANVRAFLDVIAWAEGADYNTLFGGGTFASYADHPRQYVSAWLGGREITSSAAGRYQFLARTWDTLKARLGLVDFSPASQDAAAVELIREKGALRDVQAGRFDLAVSKVRAVWASLPGAGYSQPEKSLTSLQAVYARAGGTFEA
jgi:lysozyme